MVQEKTDSVIRQEGIQVLMEHLGYVDAERFISLMIREPFDYTKWRKTNLEDIDVHELSHRAMDYVDTLK